MRAQMGPRPQDAVTALAYGPGIREQLPRTGSGPGSSADRVARRVVGCCGRTVGEAGDLTELGPRHGTCFRCHGWGGVRAVDSSPRPIHGARANLGRGLTRRLALSGSFSTS